MKRLPLLIVIACFVAAIGTLSIAQALDDKPLALHLNPEASRMYSAIEKAQEKLREQYGQLENQKTMLRTGAGVPDTFNCVAVSEVVTCMPPPKPTPTPKGN